VLEQISDLLYREARLLDTGALDDWLALYTEDATYWVPLDAGQTDPHTGVSHIFDDRPLMEVRVRQFDHPRAHARIPRPRTVHQIGNVQILDDDGREIRVASTLVMHEYRNDRERIWAALVEHRARRTAAGLRIAAKRVDLVNAEAELSGIVSLL
jgi:3-phenylpropionate/cinnamic acid dioxygenase small subunit